MSVIVKTSVGELKGRKLESVRGGSYYSFQGIPYAKPPVGPLRFKAPQPAEPWTGVRDALREGPTCPSVHMLTHEYIETSSEDCLYLNVYTPDVKPNEKKAVMFWVHGGGFARGSGDTDVYGPDYLITEDVVVVTINYRLGPLGFLSLQTKDCSGNWGMKDQVMALRWVNQHISNFGGDPGRVMIFGESAGGCAISYLMLSPLTQGLFQSAISQSGCALNPWGCARLPREYAFALGKSLGLTTTDEKELLQFLLKAPAKDLVLKVNSIQPVDVKEQIAPIPFVPVVEPEGTEGAFITKKPADMVAAGEIHDVPFIIGAVEMEGAIVVRGGAGIDKDEDLYKLIPSDWVFDRSSGKVEEITRRIKEHYFKDGYTPRKYIDALTDIYFFNGIQKYIDGVVTPPTRKSPLYVYYFLFDGDNGLMKKQIGYGNYKGNVHGDEVAYLFHVNMAKAKLTPNTREYKVVETITKLWSNFAKTNNPTHGHNVKWEQTTNNDRYYLEIDEELTLKKNLQDTERIFWYQLYDYACNSK